MENKVEVPQKTKNRATVWPNDPIPGHVPRDDRNSKRYMHPRFIAALFTTARTWKQTWCPSTDEWIKKLWDIYTMECYSADWNCAICRDVDGPRECQTEWSNWGWNFKCLESLCWPRRLCGQAWVEGDPMMLGLQPRWPHTWTEVRHRRRQTCSCGALSGSGWGFSLGFGLVRTCLSSRDTCWIPSCLPYPSRAQLGWK